MSLRPKKPPTGVPSLFLRIARRTSKQMARQLKVAILQLAKQDLFLFMPVRLNSTIDNCLYVMLALRRYIRESPKRNIFPMLEMDSRNYPLPPPCQCWRHKREKSNAPACAQSKRPFVDARSNIEIPGARGYTSSNNEISSSTTHTIVAECQTSCETHGPAIPSARKQSVRNCQQHKQASIHREDTREKLVGCQISGMLCFHMYKPRTNPEYASNQRIYSGRNTWSAKALACWFFICTNLNQTLFKPEIYWAGPCHQVQHNFKGNSNEFLFLCAATVDFLRCIELEFDWGLYIWKHNKSKVWSWHGFLQ